MNREEFIKITTQVTEKILKEFEENGMSSKAAFAATMTMQLFACELEDALFVSDEITIEPDKEV